MTKATNLQRKIIGVPLQKSFVKSEDGSVLVRGFFTSDKRDEVGDIITRTATEAAIPKYRQWGNIRYMHLPRPVGRVTRIGVEDGLAWNEVEIRVIDPQAVFEVENGLLQALSVGILVDFNEVDFLEDGGWIINNYQLSEISLVDHPANYDARLQLGLNETLRSKAREVGLIPALRSMGIFQEGENDMTKQKSASVESDQAPVEKDITPAVEATAEAANVADAPEEQEVPAGEVELQEPAETLEQAEPTEKEAPVEEAQPTVEIPSNEELKALLGDFTKSIGMLMQSLQEAASQISASTEQHDAAAAKALGTKEQPAADDIAEGAAQKEIEALRSQIADLSDRVKELSTPVDRKAELPTESIEKDLSATEEEPEPGDLRAAVKRFVNTHSK